MLLTEKTSCSGLNVKLSPDTVLAQKRGQTIDLQLHSTQDFPIGITIKYGKCTNTAKKRGSSPLFFNFSTTITNLNIQINHIKCIFLNKFFAGLHNIPHQGRKDLICLFHLVNFNL